MKIVTRTSALLAALLVCLAVSPLLAAGPMVRSPYGNARMAANPNAQSRVSNRITSQTMPPAAAPEQIAAPPAAASPVMDGQFYDNGDAMMWDGMGDGAGCDDGSCGTCGSCRNGLWYFSADYLLVRPRFSQAVALETLTETTQTEGQEVVSSTVDNSVSYCFNYNSSFRVALGYRLLDCGGDIQFAYWRLTGADSVSAGPASVEDGQLIIIGQLQCNPEDGQSYTASTGVTANIYDIDFAKCLALGGPTETCDCNWCPRWDLRWSAGARIGDVTRFNNNFVTDEDGNIVQTGNIDARFTGAGPRVGVQGRRYFGQCGLWSVYAKGSQALLIGDFNMSRVKQAPGDSPSQTEITSQFDDFCRMIPVTDIEIGGSWQVAPYAFISAGWFFQAWWDLGQAENISAGTSFGPLDSANILGFDGLFIRAELLF